MTATYDLTDAAALSAALVAPGRFPTHPYGQASTFTADYLQALAHAASTMDLAAVDRAAAILLEAYTTGALVFSCGNGGSAAISNHLQCDHLKGVGNGTDLLPRVVSLANNVELITAIGNDLGYEEVFVHQLQSQARAGDVLLAISSSGKSPNIVKAIGWAREHGLRTIAITGFEGGPARTDAEVAVHVDCTNYGVVEDLHQAVMHSMAQYIRQSRLSAGTIATTTF